MKVKVTIMKLKSLNVTMLSDFAEMEKKPILYNSRIQLFDFLQDLIYETMCYKCFVDFCRIFAPW